MFHISRDAERVGEKELMLHLSWGKTFCAETYPKSQI